MSIVLVALIHGFLGKQQYAAIALKRLTIKLSKVLCLGPKVTVRVAMESNVPPVLYFEFVIGCFDNGPFPEKQFVIDGYQCTFHIALQLGYKLYSINEQSLKQVLSYISHVSDKLSIYKFYKGFIFKRFTVINITQS